VEQELTLGTRGLITLENTLEPKILIKWSIRDNNESIEQFNATSKSAIKRLLRKDRVQDPLTRDILE
jgi:hypothetical protein